ncbi:HipA domain-containing protein [Paenibacillus xylanexedens]|uniref:HipA domain-containing protein n=1 Tax=Paenibacillus xylanexedens TaxID=528191 RepID=UPI0021B17963|nr:HipA domain-containing protein [Paenibacillus xylanexedens]
MSIPVLHVNKDHRQTFVSSSKGDQLKWKIDQLWGKANKFGYEGLAEWVASELIARSNISSTLIVPYKQCLLIENDIQYVGCFSEDFLRPGESLITLHRILESYGVKFDEILKGQSTRDSVLSVVEFLKRVLNLDTLEYFSVMLPLDAILLNEDRHLNNIAFIHGSEGYRLCPFFDHGLSLMSDTKDYPLSMPVSVGMRKVKAKPFSSDFSKQVHALETNLQFNRSSVLEFIEQYDQALGRVSQILRSQIRKYEHLFI